MATATQQNGRSPAKQKDAPQPTQADKDKALLDEILSRKAVFTPFHESAPITLTVGMVLRHFAKPTKRGFMPTEAQAEKFVMLCKTRGLNPYVGDAFIVGYDTEDGPEFNLITAHQALLKRAEAHAQFAGMHSGVIVRRPVEGGGETIEYEGKYVEPGDTLVGAWAKVKRRDRDEPKFSRVALTAFNKGFGRWKNDTAGMIVKCAQADALRESFPNELGGLHVEEEFGSNESREPVRMPRSVEEKTLANAGIEPTKATADKQAEAEEFGTGDPEKEAAALAAFQASGIDNPAK